MSALGQKQTFRSANVMSALPPIATAKADFRTRSCLLYPQKRTCAVQLEMSAKGQKRTLAISTPRVFGRSLAHEVTWTLLLFHAVGQNRFESHQSVTS
jgi:hypothetical protein